MRVDISVWEFDERSLSLCQSLRQSLWRSCPYDWYREGWSYGDEAAEGHGVVFEDIQKKRPSVRAESEPLAGSEHGQLSFVQ